MNPRVSTVSAMKDCEPVILGYLPENRSAAGATGLCPETLVSRTMTFTFAHANSSQSTVIVCTPPASLRGATTTPNQCQAVIF